jgi:hypothetical protein
VELLTTEPSKAAKQLHGKTMADGCRDILQKCKGTHLPRIIIEKRSHPDIALVATNDEYHM